MKLVNKSNKFKCDIPKEVILQGHWEILRYFRKWACENDKIIRSDGTVYAEWIKKEWVYHPHTGELPKK